VKQLDHLTRVYSTAQGHQIVERKFFNRKGARTETIP